MERRITNFLDTNSENNPSYINHDGRGISSGYGDKYGNGKGYSYYINYESNPMNSIIEYNGYKTRLINNQLIYITNIKHFIAKGKIINPDFTTKDCYVGKINNFFIVESSIRKVIEELKKIVKKRNNITDLAIAFVETHPYYEKEYEWGEMLYWHTLSNNSCQHGRNKFSEYAKKTNKSKCTPKELIQHMKQMKPSVQKLALELEDLYLQQIKKK